jgi:predicted CXXCH cytochrome family protein
MHRMTRDVTLAQIGAPFRREYFTLQGDTAQMRQVDGARELVLDKSDGSQSTYRVTKVIGGRFREDFVGIELDPSTDRRARNEERILPVSYLLFNQSYRYKGYSVLVTERKGLESGQVWRQTCIFCHNTPPQFDGLLDELYGPGSPSYQGSASDDAPPGRRFRYVITDEVALRDALGLDIRRLGSKAAATETLPLLREAMLRTRKDYGEGHLVELGIGCEACHGGSREHVMAPSQVKPSFALQSPFLKVLGPDNKEPSRTLEINRTCARCHTVLFTHYPYTWEGGHRHTDPGGSPINSGEARDFLLGGCRTQLDCTKCHDPHSEDSREHLDALAGPAGDAICTGCHRSLDNPVAASAHSHHAPDNAGSHCLNCHMPKKNMGLAYQLTRYHRIGSPTDRERVEHDRPLECALCHTTMNVEQILSTMERWWNKRYSRKNIAHLYGRDLSVDAIQATLVAGLPHEQAVAVSIAAESGRHDLLPLVARVMTNDYPLVRYFAKKSAEQLSGTRISIDPAAPKSRIDEQVGKWIAERATP